MEALITGWEVDLSALVTMELPGFLGLCVEFMECDIFLGVVVDAVVVIAAG